MRPRALVTRAEGQAGALEAALEAVGFAVVAVALTRVEAVEGVLPERRPGDVIAFTSANAARALGERGALGWLEGAQVAAVGQATAAALRALGVTPSLVPATATGAALAAALGAGRRVLHPRAREALDDLRAGVEALGGEYVAAPVYRVAPIPEAAQAVAAALPVDVIPLMSPSAARALASLGLDLGAARVVVIGPTTAAACEALGLRVAAVAQVATVEGLAEVAVGRRVSAPVSPTDNTPSWRDLAAAHDWRPIPGCPGRFVLCGGKSALPPASFVAGATVGRERRVPGVRDPVVVVPLAEGGLLSYRHDDGTWTHTLGDGDGFGRKLAQLGMAGS